MPWRAGQRRPPLLFETVTPTGTSIGRDERGVAARFVVRAPTTLTSMAVQVDLLSATGNLNFFIFDSLTEAALFQNGIETFTDDGSTFKLSSAFSFTLDAGVTYAIGAATDVAAD